MNCFFLYYDRLVAYAVQLVGQPEAAEEAVSVVFVKLWQQRHQLTSVRIPEAYLYRAVKNTCLNIRRRKGREPATLYLSECNVLEGTGGQPAIETKELYTMLSDAIAKLPEKRRFIFQLVKIHGLRTREVARVMNLSERTVENQLYKAVRTLADAISDYLGYHPVRTRSRRPKLPGLLFF